MSSFHKIESLCLLENPLVHFDHLLESLGVDSRFIYVECDFNAMCEDEASRIREVLERRKTEKIVKGIIRKYSVASDY